jgi:predicted Zn-dependent protease
MVAKADPIVVNEVKPQAKPSVVSQPMVAKAVPVAINEVKPQIAVSNASQAQEKQTVRPEILAIAEHDGDPIKDASQRKQHNNKRLIIAEVSQRLQQAIARNDVGAVTAGFDQLHTLTPPDSTFSLKMQAFWSLKQGDNKKSRTLLGEVLKRNPSDVDAGLNMAVMEILANEPDQARRRLEELAVGNPDNPTIHSLLERVGR